MTILATIAAAFGIISGLFNLPQIIKIYRRKSAKDISALTYIGLLTGSIVWIFYGLEINNIPVLILNGYAAINFIIILFGWYLYGR